MSFTYKYLDDVALADAAFEVRADNWGCLFSGATEALTAVMVDLDGLGRAREHAMEISAPTVEELLYDWLSEIVYLKDTEGLLVRSAEVRIRHEIDWEAQGTLFGDTLNANRHTLGQDVKAVTYHLFEVRREGEEYRAKIVLDI